MVTRDASSDREDDLRREIATLEQELAQADAPRTLVLDELATMREQLARSGASPRYQLANVRVAAPCKQRWAAMIGDERVRVCNGCDRPVFNLSEMTREQAEAVLATSGVTPCVRFYRRSDGTVMTADCPTGAPRAGRRLTVVATGAALLGASSVMAEPRRDDARPSAAGAPDATPDSEEGLVRLFGPEATMGVVAIDPPAEPSPTPTLEGATWIRAGYGLTSPGGEAAVGAELSLAIAGHGDLRLGAWAEIGTSSGPVLGGELIIEGFAPHLDGADPAGSGGLVVRAGGNPYVMTAVVGYGPGIGARVVTAVTRSLDDPRAWAATIGVELDPIGVVEHVARLVRP